MENKKASKSLVYLSFRVYAAKSEIKDMFREFERLFGKDPSLPLPAVMADLRDEGVKALKVLNEMTELLKKAGEFYWDGKRI